MNLPARRMPGKTTTPLLMALPSSPSLAAVPALSNLTMAAASCRKPPLKALLTRWMPGGLHAHPFEPIKLAVSRILATVPASP